MNIQKFRPSFSCHVVKDKNLGEGVVRGISQAGYKASVFTDVQGFLEGAKKDPPHFVCLMKSEFDSEIFKKEILQIHQLLPETQIFALVSKQQIPLAYEQIGRSVYSIVPWPLSHPLQLIKELDHSAENTYYFYQNEQLHEALKKGKSEASILVKPEDSLEAQGESEESFFSYADFQRKLFQQLSHGSSVEIFMRELHRVFDSCSGKAVYFKYVGARKTIIHQFSAGIHRNDIEGLGIQFAKEDPNFRKSHIKTIENHPVFKKMLNDVFQVEKVHILKLEVLGEVFGILAIWDIDSESEEFAYLLNSFSLLNRSCLSVELEKRLHINQIFDPVSLAYNKHHFMQKMAEEIARARRTSLPVSLILIGVDNFENLSEQSDREDFSLFLKSLVRIIQKHSRINDVIGRMGQDEFGLLLPHTASKGGAIKAERIRRMIESADFSQVLQDQPQVTLSMSVSEYPSVCKDADELFQSADRSLYELKKSEPNKVVMVSPPDGFIADFVTPKLNY